MDTTPEALPDDVDALKAALAAERRQRLEDTARIEAELAVARAKASDDQALIAHQQLQIEKLKRQLYGQRSERAARLLDQMELSFEELESTATEDEVVAEAAVATARGLATAQFWPEECCIKSGALYVYHRKALARLLQAQAGALAAVGLPLNPDRFVKHIAAVWVEPDHPAYPIVAAAFGDSA